MTIEDIPLSTAALIEWLDAMYPPRMPKHGEDLESIYRYAGKRELIDKLKQIINQRPPYV